MVIAKAKVWGGGELPLPNREERRMEIELDLMRLGQDIGELKAKAEEAQVQRGVSSEKLDTISGQLIELETKFVAHIEKEDEWRAELKKWQEALHHRLQRTESRRGFFRSRAGIVTSLSTSGGLLGVIFGNDAVWGFISKLFRAGGH